MQRTIVEPADISGEALSELKAWLGVTRPNEDELLTSLLKSSLDIFEGYTGQAPLSQTIEERVPTRAGRYPLSSRPITSLASVEVIADDGNRDALPNEAFDFETQASGSAEITLLTDNEGQALAIQMQVGLAATWSTVPSAAKQGLIRLAAYLYRDRDVTGGAKPDASPPSSVIALWRPWRTLRLR